MTSDLTLSGKVAIVTGAGRYNGIGRHIALALARNGADVVITGEGRLDRQSAFGKTTSGVSRLAHAARTPVVALAGEIDEGTQDVFDAAFALSPDLAPLAEAKARAGELLSALAETKVAGWIVARNA